MTIIDDYLAHQSQFEKKYGPNTIVLYEVGSFYEIYGLNNDKEVIGKPAEIAELLNIQLTRRNKEIRENNRSNPLMAGFQSGSLQKYLRILVQNNYTVVLVEQTTPSPNPKREVTNIISSGTNLEENGPEANDIISIYMEKTEPIKNSFNNDYWLIGLSSVDITTGKCSAYEVKLIADDSFKSLDETYRYIHSLQPREIIISIVGNETTQKDAQRIITYLDLSNQILHVKVNDVDKKFYQIAYQNNFLQKIYSPTGMISGIEHVNLEKYSIGLLSFIILLQFVYEHNEIIIQKIKTPTIWESSKQLVLDYNSILQLNILPHNGTIKSTSSTKNSVFSIIKYTSTSMGHRLLKERLVSPIIDSNELNSRYNLIESMIPIFASFEPILKQIVDIERLHRKMFLGRLQPSEFVVLDISYNSIIDLIEKTKTVPGLIKLIDFDVNHLLQYRNTYLSIFDLNIMATMNMANTNKSFFKPGHYQDLDQVQNQLDQHYQYLTDMTRYLSSILTKGLNNNTVGTGETSNYVRLDHNDRDGYFLVLTNKRYEILKKCLPVDLVNTLEVKTLNNSKKIFSNDIRTCSNMIISLQDKIRKLCNEYYLKILQHFSNEYQVILQKITSFVSEIDVIKSCAKAATLHKYCKPRVSENVNEQGSFIVSTKMRHPLIERLLIDEFYVPNDITIGKNETNGMLIFGVNYVGKSSLMRMIGVNLILAQAGMYVSAESFQYKPFTQVLTRMTNDDNLFKGQSSFYVEMLELKAILNRANQNSLVLGDEISRGTEQTSGLAIVAAAITELSKRNVNFVFATHLHQLSKMKRITDLPNVKSFHLKVERDKTNKLIYDRTLIPGSGSSIYGIEVTKAVLLKQEFIDLAMEIRREIEHSSAIKPSHFNPNVYPDKCNVCSDKAVDVHHIRFQKDADCYGYINGIHKNSESNLVPICKKCHNDVHAGKIVIEGYKKTLEGIILSYEKK